MKAETEVAIQTFETAERRRVSCEVADAKLAEAVQRVPKEDMDEYVRVTEGIARTFEERLEVRLRPYRTRKVLYV